MENMVAYHTAIPFRVVAGHAPGRKARDRARADTLLGNHIAVTNDLNGTTAEAMYIAGVYGSCPVHATWREDISGNQYHPIWNPDGQGVRDGYVDLWVGDPWSTVYDDGATRNSIHRASYGRTIPTALLRNAFGGVPWIADITGRTDLPSASRFQRIVRRWQYLNDYLSGSAVVNQSGNKNDEMTAILCDELAPGMDPNWPEGRLVIVALDKSATTDVDPDTAYRPLGNTRTEPRRCGSSRAVPAGQPRVRRRPP